MDIYHIGEALVQWQLDAKHRQASGAWVTLAPNSTSLIPIVAAKLENEDGSCHTHQQSQPSILYVFAGTASVTIASQTMTLTSGNLLFVKPHQQYQLGPLKAGDVLVTLLLPVDAELSQLLPIADDHRMHQQLQAIKQAYGTWGYANFNNDKIDDPAYIVERIICEIVSPAQFATARIDGFLHLLLIELIRRKSYVAPSRKSLPHQVTTADLLQYIDQNYDVCSLKIMAQAFHYNPNYLSNRLKTATGQSFIQLIDSRRMREALILLENPRVSIDEVVTYIGYSSKSFFYKKFKERYGESPTKMRQRLLC
ncbi:helix-turn-helix domain-containing protein [Lactiplantibacillus daowaiensis]|uniref:Helix-turn-helix domain-containing protein n=1 Tax=Lactiplantibacillus daowaiensis TaxID=2559918 RepID=A0ABW1S4G7_9LACO|nr:AraC family transcriptional regulator [Lactiplantibacillus daowaiensis]